MSIDEKSLLKPINSTDHNNKPEVVNEESLDNTSKKGLPHPTSEMKYSLSFLQKVGFGLGHVYNDLCAGVWFSYTLLFMQGVLELSGSEAGFFVMLGQIGDALATPIVGILADKYGTKRKWHIAGILCQIYCPMESERKLSPPQVLV